MNITKSHSELAGLRVETLMSFQSIDRVENRISYFEFFTKYLLLNQPCILAPSFTDHWKSREEWCKDDGSPNFEFLQASFGNIMVPVANCGREEYGSHPKTEMKFEDFIKYWVKYRNDGYPDTGECLYLKDFHFSKNVPEYKAYDTPEYFTSDWMNEFWDQRDDEDDYRFVYMGPKGSWTPFHADVFRSFSWSANICGKKRWIFYPPGEENFLKHKVSGQLVFDVTSDDLKDPRSYPLYSQVTHPGGIEVIQLPGEVIFVPSGWHHQVHNLEDTISINHNWLNSCNVDISWDYIKQGLLDVMEEIEDCKEDLVRDKEWCQRCQMLLKADKGINYPEYFKFMKTILQPRIKFLQLSDSGKSESYVSEQQNYVVNKLISLPHWKNKDCVLFDVQRIKSVLQNMQNNPEFSSYCEEINDPIRTDIDKLLQDIDHVLNIETIKKQC